MGVFASKIIPLFHADVQNLFRYNLCIPTVGSEIKQWSAMQTKRTFDVELLNLWNPTNIWNIYDWKED
jgi:hypothetical protein